MFGEKVGDVCDAPLANTEPDAPINAGGCYYDRVEGKTMAALSTKHSYDSLRNASRYCSPGNPYLG